MSKQQPWVYYFPHINEILFVCLSSLHKTAFREQSLYVTEFRADVETLRSALYTEIMIIYYYILYK